MDEFVIEKEWIGEFDNAPPCIYNANVGCPNQECDRCGWNPFVSLGRIIIKYGDKAADYLTPPGC